MLGLGWTEMLVIGVVALIFIGPKDLPVVMGRVGKVIGQVQRMGREFQREINKTTGLDEVRNLRTSITSPLKKTAEEIRRDFNTIGKDGKESPSGALKPTDPNTESVVEAIQQQAGMTPVGKSNDELAADYGFKSGTSEPAKTEPVKAAPEKSAPVKAARTTTRTTATKSPATKAAPAKSDASAPKSAAKATAKLKAEAKPVEPASAPATTPKPKAVRTPAAPKAAEAKPAAKPRAPRKKPADRAGKSE